jgi:uncharacterized protein YdhG (YjbR/CyaY superfamily)
MATKTTKKKAAGKTVAPMTVDDYIAAAPKDKRAVLTKLRKTIKAAAPKATESVSYGIVGFKHRGKYLVYLGYWTDHLSLYGFGSDFISAHAAELKAYDVDKGTLRFTAEKPLPDRLVTRIVKSRIAEIERAAKPA